MLIDIRNESRIDLKSRFTDVFLYVSKKLQKNGIWIDDKEGKIEIKGKTRLQELFEYTLKNLGVIYGYFAEYEPNNNEVRYFLVDSRNSLIADASNFKPPYIPYFKGDNSDLFLNSIHNNLETKFLSILRAPKIYQHLPLQPQNNSNCNLISDRYLNCYIPCKIKRENDYYVVLYDEIVFFKFAFSYITERDIFTSDNISFNSLLYLVKFALSIEQKLGLESLHCMLKLIPNKANWNTVDEIKLRDKIHERITGFFDKEWKERVITLVKEIVEELLKQYVDDEIYFNFSNEEKKVKVLKHIARFDIEASLFLYWPHDIFVFPLYTQSDTPVLKTKFVNPEFEINVYSPIVLVLYIQTLNELKPPKYDEDEESIDGFQLTKEIIKQFAQRLIQEEYFKNVIQKELQPAAIRAAISQVMARNTSHNIGAHVMNKLISNLREIALIQNPEANQNYQSTQTLVQLYADVVKKIENNIAFKEFRSEAIKNEILLDQIAIFNNYVKCRMDYLADVSFGTPLMQTNKYAYADLFKEFDKVRLLLDYISGLGENFKYEIQFEYNDKPMSDENDLPIAIPNDILGMQAFFNILENIIRNTAKHGKQKLPITTFTVNFIDTSENSTGGEQNSLNDYIAVEVYDNIPVEGSGRYLTDEEQKEYKRVMGSTPVAFFREIDTLVFSQNRRINTDILKDNQLRSGALGVVEMDASAAYLRKRDVSLINHDNYTVRYDESWCADSIKAQSNLKERGTDCRHFLKAFKKNNGKDIDNNPVFVLGYRFFLLRPELVLIVTNVGLDTDKNQDYVKELKKQGIWIVKPDDFEEHLGKSKVYNHEFVIIDNTIQLSKVESTLGTQNSTKAEISLTEDYKSLLSLRILAVDNSELNSFFDEIISDDKKDWQQRVEKFCWEKWSDIVKQTYPCEKKVHEGTCTNTWSVGSSYNPRVCKSIVLLNHSDSFDSDSKEDFFTMENLSSKGFYSLPNAMRYKDLTEYLSDLRKDKITKAKLLDSAVYKILVIDERIQSASKTETFKGTKLIEYFKAMRITVPELDFATINIDSVWQKEFDILFNNDNLRKYDFVLIHFSLLERRYSSSERDKEIRELLESKSGKTKVIITSGRGIPKGLPSQVSFVNLSSVIAAFIEVRSKYAISNLLNSARKANLV